MAEIAVADTHAVVWWFSGQKRKLGRAARRFFERADTGSALIYVPVLGIVELGENIHRGRVSLSAPLTEWFEVLRAHRGFATTDLTVEMALRAEELYAIPERGDRLIAATALELDLPLITRDPEIERVAGVETLW